MTPELESFREAFSPHASSCRVDCECGTIYFDSYSRDISWEPGELEFLENNAVAQDHSIGWVQFEGKQYAYDCRCWHARAAQIIRFLGEHGHGISRFFKLEKERQVKAANELPTMDDIQEEDV